MNCTFKHTRSGIKFNIVIEPNIPLNKLKENINESVSSIMGINNNNYIIIIAGLPQKELANPIDLNSTAKFKSIDKNVFYIRPTREVVPINNHSITTCINECIVCNQNMNCVVDTWTSCNHYRTCCNSCVSLWISACQNTRRIPNCPICRRNIQR